jgi:hypothetical protein
MYVILGDALSLSFCFFSNYMTGICRHSRLNIIWQKNFCCATVEDLYSDKYNCVFALPIHVYNDTLQKEDNN